MGTYSVLKKARVSSKNSVIMVPRANKLKKLPRLVPSIKSVGTLRYMSRDPIHRRFILSVHFVLFVDANRNDF